MPTKRVPGHPGTETLSQKTSIFFIGLFMSDVVIVIESRLTFYYISTANIA